MRVLAGTRVQSDWTFVLCGNAAVLSPGPYGSCQEPTTRLLCIQHKGMYAPNVMVAVGSWRKRKHDTACQPGMTGALQPGTLDTSPRTFRRESYFAMDSKNSAKFMTASSRRAALPES